jgi:hypothetical protein
MTVVRCGRLVVLDLTPGVVRAQFVAPSLNPPWATVESVRGSTACVRSVS